LAEKINLFTQRTTDMLKEILEAKINKKRERIARLLEDHGQVKIGEWTLAHLFNGERGLELLVSDLSFVDQDGLKVHGIPVRSSGDSPGRMAMNTP
jgi:hypothetical protein